MREVEQLDLEQLCGQLLVIGFNGTTVPDVLRAQLQRNALGGVILFGRNLPDVETSWALCRQVADLCTTKFPPFIGVDQEGGRVRRLRDRVLDLPPLGVWAPLAETHLRRKVVFQQAIELAAIGFNLNFAPVIDVNSNPQNPIIGDRSPSGDPRLVTQIGSVLIEAQQAAGVMACLKHFPGHGDTTVDSHHELPTVNKSTVELRSTELYPFERLSRHAAAVMTAHVLFPVLDNEPATFSPRLCTTLLRKEFAFEGVLFSDDLEMGALSHRWTIEESALKAVKAGCDALLLCSSPELQQRAHRALVAQAEKDPAFRARVLEAVERGLLARRRFPPSPAHDKETLLTTLDSHAHRDAQRRVNALVKSEKASPRLPKLTS
jgi:beta-N-acetylhexosaminidase